jgi:hypothetical protein
MIGYWKLNLVGKVFVKLSSKERNFNRKKQQKMHGDVQKMHCSVMEELRKFLFSPTSNLLWKCGAEIFLLLLIVRVNFIPNLSKAFAIGTVLHKYMIALAHVISHFLPVDRYFCVASLSLAHFHPWYSKNTYWINNFVSLMPVTVMVLLCVNTAATACDSLCLLCCSPDCQSHSS